MRIHIKFQGNLDSICCAVLLCNKQKKRHHYLRVLPVAATRSHLRPSHYDVLTCPPYPDTRHQSISFNVTQSLAPCASYCILTHKVYITLVCAQNTCDIWLSLGKPISQRVYLENCNIRMRQEGL